MRMIYNHDNSVVPCPLCDEVGYHTHGEVLALSDRDIDTTVEKATAAERERCEAKIKRLREAIIRAKDALLDGQSTQWVHDLLVDAVVREGK